MTESHGVRKAKEQRVDGDLCVVVRRTGSSVIKILWLSEGMNFGAPQSIVIPFKRDSCFQSEFVIEFKGKGM